MNSINPPIVIIDVPVLLGRFAYTYHGRYKDKESRVSDIVLPFLRMVQRVQSEWDTDRLFFCWDSDESLRKSIYPEYKCKMEDILSEEQNKEQIHRLRYEVLPECGFENHWETKGYGSDDCIAFLVKYFNARGEDIVVKSFDTALYQLFQYSTLLTFMGSHDVKFTELDYIRKYGIGPDRWIDVLSISGNGFHKVHGVQNVGMASAIRFIAGDLKDKKKLGLIQNNEVVIEEAKDLLTIPHKSYLTIIYPEMVCSKYRGEVEKVVVRHGFQDTWNMRTPKHGIE